MGKTVLIAEDDKDVRDLLGESLIGNGFFVKEAGNGNEALDVLKKEEIHLILLDLIMPGLDGCNFIRQVRLSRLANTIPIIVITGKRNVLASYELEGISRIFHKPFKEEELITVVRRILKEF